MQQITSGPWQVSKDSIWVDQSDKLIYFQGEQKMSELKLQVKNFSF